MKLCNMHAISPLRSSSEAVHLVLCTGTCPCAKEKSFDWSVVLCSRILLFQVADEFMLFVNLNRFRVTDRVFVFKWQTCSHCLFVESQCEESVFFHMRSKKGCCAVIMFEGVNIPVPQSLKV